MSKRVGSMKKVRLAAQTETCWDQGPGQRMSNKSFVANCYIDSKNGGKWVAIEIKQKLIFVNQSQMNQGIEILVQEACMEDLIYI